MSSYHLKVWLQEGGIGRCLIDFSTISVIFLLVTINNSQFQVELVHAQRVIAEQRNARHLTEQRAMNLEVGLYLLTTLRNYNNYLRISWFSNT